jgi:hypothetical protein
LLAGISLTAFMLRLNEPGPEKASGPSATSSATPAAGVPIVNVPAASVALPAAPVQPDAASAPVTDELPSKKTYSAAPEETGAVQVITVAAMPGQTLRDISLVYIGRFDAELLQEIRALNPELKDVNHPAAGQLVRLPLPAGSFKKGKEFKQDE